MTNLYRIEELSTSGWELIIEGSEYRKLNREQAKEKLNLLIQSGSNPNRLRAVPDND